MTECRIVGPYLPAGDDEWRCATHNVNAVLRDESIWRIRQVRREDFICPLAMTEEVSRG